MSLVLSQDPSILVCKSDTPIINEPNLSESTSFATLEVLTEGTLCPTMQVSATFKDFDDLHRSFAALISVGKEKNPITPKWQLARTDISDPKNKGQHYIGILCGPVNGIDVVDCDIVKQEDLDRYNRYIANCKQFECDGYYLTPKGAHVNRKPKEEHLPRCAVRWMHENFPDFEKNTLVVRSQSGGRHYYFQDAGLMNGACVLKDDKTIKIDARGRGGQIISPFSRSTRSGNVTPQNEIP